MNHRAMYKRPTRNVYEDKRNHETLLEIDACLNPEKKLQCLVTEVTNLKIMHSGRS